MQVEHKTTSGTIVKRCMNSHMPLDFIYEKSSNSYRLDLYDTDEKLLQKVRTGKGDPSIFKGSKFLYLEGFLAEIEPKDDFKQQLNPNPINPVGENNLDKAKVARYSYFIDPDRNKEVAGNAYLGFEETLHAIVKEWAAKT